jgi:hypothetical protein
MRGRIGTGVVLACGAIFGSSLAFAGVHDTAASAAGAGAAELARGHWSVLAHSSLGPRVNATLVWTGRQLLEAGGQAPGRYGNGNGESSETDAAAFNPRTGSWRALAALPSRSVAVSALSVWTGNSLFLMAQPQLPVTLAPAHAAVYDVGTDSWSSAPPAPIDAPSVAAAGVWSAGRVVVATVSGDFVHGTTLATAAYDPADHRWSKIPLTLPPGHDAAGVAMVATGDGVVLWSLWSRSHEYGKGNFTVHSGVDVFRLSGNRWVAQPVDWPQHRTVDQPIFTGSSVLLGASQTWCGVCSHPAPFDANGWDVNPTTLVASKLPHGPLDDLGPQILWTGAAEIALNTHGQMAGSYGRILPGDIAFLDISASRWYRGPRAPQPIASGTSVVWDGSKLLVLAADGGLLSYGQ